MNNPRLGYLHKKAAGLPMEPGVYLMKDSQKKIIYIGKAKSLKNRVSSYFRSVEKHLPKVYRMVEQVFDFDYIVTSSEFEALVLECSLIKQHSPKYNILLKDDKGYSYIKVFPKEWSRITSEKQREEDGALYLGPYTSSYVVKSTVEEANKLFLLPTCSRKFPQDFRRERPCLNYHIKQCMAPCQGNISLEEYQDAVAQALEYIRDGGSNLVERLTQQMEQYAENMEYEKAARCRDRIRAIEKVGERQKVIFIRAKEQDVIGLGKSADNCCVVVLKFRNNRLHDQDFFLLGQMDNLDSARQEFVLRYYSSRRELPRQILLDGPLEDAALVESYLTQLKGAKVNLLFPQKGEQASLVDMARKNCAEHLAEQSGRTGREVAALDELGRLLGLSKPPEYIEAYDISNIGGSTVVAGMAVFDRGRPLKAAYRKFSVRCTQGAPDDYASMREVITRRLLRYKEHEGQAVGFGRLPDLILLDGGKGHVATILPVLEELGFSIPVFGMVKDDRHRTRAIATDGGEIAFPPASAAFRLVTQIQDEVHRFSISYSRSSHQKKSFSMLIDQVEGVGEKRRAALFQRFKTLKAMREATLDDLAAVEGMNRPTAQALYDFLHGD